MKYCPDCREYRPFQDFGKHVTRGYQSYCRTCKRERDRAYARKNRKKVYARNRSWVRSQRSLAEKSKKRPCADCGRSYPSFVMDFDHVRGEKLFTIGEAAGHVSASSLKAEIAKCDVVCANCHRTRTHSGNSTG